MRKLAHQGFTLIELIMVLVLAGVLAAFAAPRLFNTGDFYALGFHDETLALLRYAQKTAIAQRRPVCVLFGATTASLSVDADRNSATGTNGCETSLSTAQGGSIVARGTVQYATVPTAIVFDGQGQPSAGQTLQIAGTADIVVESATGYVH